MKGFFSVLLRREIRRFFGGKFFCIFFFFASFLIGMLACVVYCAGDEYDSEGEVGIFVESEKEEIRKAVTEALKECDGVQLLFDNFSERRVLTGEFVTAVVVGQDIRVVYDSSRMAKTEPVYYAKDVAAKIALAIQDPSLIREYRSMTDAKEIDVSSPAEKLRAQPMWLLIFFSMIAGLGIGTAINMIVGNSFKEEVNQGTFDLLRQTMSSPKMIAVCKIIFVKAVVLISGALALSGFVVATRAVCSDEWRIFSEAIQGRWDRVLLSGVAFLMAMQITSTVAILGQSNVGGGFRRGAWSLISSVAAPGSLLLFLCFDFPFEKYLPGFNLWSILGNTIENKGSQAIFTISLFFFVLVEILLTFLSVVRLERSLE